MFAHTYLHLLICCKVISDARELERIIDEQGFYVDNRLQKRPESGHWVTSQPEYVVIDDVTIPRPGITTGITTPDVTTVHPLFTDPSNNAVFHSLTEVTNVLTQLQVGYDKLSSCLHRELLFDGPRPAWVERSVPSVCMSVSVCLSVA